MRPQKQTPRSFPRQRRLYLAGCWLCLCTLGALGLWILLLTPPDALPDAWPAKAAPFGEEHAGFGGGRARTTPGFASNGEPHNEGARQADTLGGDETEPPQIASSSVRTKPARPAITLSESGMGEITISALMPGARVNVADYVVTEAPTTLHVPWPANYTVAVHVDETTVYETRVRLSAENNKISFGVDPEMGLD